MKNKKLNNKDDIPVCSYEPKADDYDQLDPRTHVYTKPGMYIGSIDKLPREEWIFNIESNKMEIKKIDIVPGVERLFLEVESNAADNCGKSRNAGLDCGIIETYMDKKKISIKNYGLSVPIEIHSKTNLYVPQMIFGSMLSGSNLNNDIERHGIGTNGIGAKAVNIFSLKFDIVIENSVMKKKYKQSWENNMLICHKPIIENYNGNVSSVEISYELDFKVFGYTEYTPEIFALFRRHVIDISFNVKIPVKFNEEYYDYSDYTKYAQLYFGNMSEKSIVHTQYKNDKLELELYVFDTPDEGNHISFVNCMMTKDGGVHVDAALKAIGSPIMKMINTKMTKKLSEKELKTKEKKFNTITLRDIEPHISMILSCKLINPDFTGQCKSYLNKPTPKIIINNEILKPIYDWNLINRLYATIDAKQFSLLTKTDGKMCKFIKLNKGKDATYAGEYKRMDCILCLSEGKSASSYLKHYISNIPDGSYYYGNLPLKGKCLNAMRASDKKISLNEEIKEIKLMLGLKEDVDYSDPVNFKKLRYGKIMICADADVDGKHIIGLVLNIFFSRFPSLLKVKNFMTYKRTPILRIHKGKTFKKFYSQREYDVWLSKNSMNGWTIKYFKGLGTSTIEDIKDDLKDEKIVTSIYDDETDRAMNLAFNSDIKYRQDRKLWITNNQERHDVDTMINQPISLFIDHEFIKFSIANLKRSLPSLIDGLKDSQRKIICGAHSKFNIGPINKLYSEVRVCNLDAHTMEKLNYHHGNNILCDIIVNMAQNFIGSNNINLFEPNGQFGTRLENGEDAASARYLNTMPSKIFPYIFHQDDQPLLDYMVDEGITIEPKVYHTVVPLILINGSKGIATGYSTFIPKHNPLDIILWLKSRLLGSDTLPSLIPWYRGFKGTINIIDRRINKLKYQMEYNSTLSEEIINEVDDLDTEEILINDDDSEISDDEALQQQNFNERPLLSFVVTGSYHILNNGNIIITELPIGTCPIKYYKKFLVPLQEKKIIKKIIDSCSVDNIKFELKGYVGKPSYLKLHLRRRYSLSNMLLLDHNNKPVRYETANDIMETFYNNRLTVYNKRREYKISNIKKHINELQIKYKFVTSILNKDLIVENVEKNIIYENLDKLNIPRILYDKAKMSNINKDELILLTTTINNLQQELQNILKLKASDIWLNDLKNLENIYKKLYK
jgi:DNA topoisomerase II